MLETTDQMICCISRRPLFGHVSLRLAIKANLSRYALAAVGFGFIAKPFRRSIIALRTRRITYSFVGRRTHRVESSDFSIQFDGLGVVFDRGRELSQPAQRFASVEYPYSLLGRISIALLLSSIAFWYCFDRR